MSNNDATAKDALGGVDSTGLFDNSTPHCNLCEYPIRNGKCACNYFAPDAGPGEEDGPWADGWETRASSGSIILSNAAVTDAKHSVD